MELNGYGFGCPRVFSGNLTDSLAERWYNFKVIRNINDIVTHVPPKIFGFQHVGILYEIGYKGRYNCIDAHRPESYIQELKSRKGAILMVSIIFNIVLPILAVLMSFVSYYFYIKAKAQEAASAAINKVEILEDTIITTSHDKLGEAVKQVYALLPASSKIFIPKAAVEFIVQKAFDNIEEYAKKQIIKNNK